MTTLSRLAEVDPRTLKAATYNPREITAEAFEALKGSLRQFGFVDPAIVNSRTGVLVGGHQRVKAAIDLGMATVPVVWIDVDETTEKALNVTLNNFKIGGFYTEGLQDILCELTELLPVGSFVEVGLDRLVEPLKSLDEVSEPLDESVEKDVAMIRCPNCAHEFPK